MDDFKMAGPKANMDEGWKLISKNIDMDTPEDAGRYLGCDHIFHHDVKLSPDHHPFAHVFDESIPRGAGCCLIQQHLKIKHTMLKISDFPDIILTMC